MQRKENLIFKKIYEGDRIRQTRLKKGLKKTLRGERENEVRKYNNRGLVGVFQRTFDRSKTLLYGDSGRMTKDGNVTVK